MLYLLWFKVSMSIMVHEEELIYSMAQFIQVGSPYLCIHLAVMSTRLILTSQ